MLVCLGMGTTPFSYSPIRLCNLSFRTFDHYLLPTAIPLTDSFEFVQACIDEPLLAQLRRSPCFFQVSLDYSMTLYRHFYFSTIPYIKVIVNTFLKIISKNFIWLRRLDLNQRFPAYETSEDDQTPLLHETFDEHNGN